MAEGVNTSLAGLAKLRVADFVHGTDGLGNTNQPTAKVGSCHQDRQQQHMSHAVAPVRPASPSRGG